MEVQPEAQFIWLVVVAIPLLEAQSQSPVVLHVAHRSLQGLSLCQVLMQDRVKLVETSL